ncbi:MAG: carboxypeptidase regulatory-like domain-containing protein [Polyangiales bacterium]
MNRRLGLVVGALIMAAIAFATRQDGLLPDDWTPRPRAVTGEEDAPEQTVDEVDEDADEEPLIAQAPQRHSATPPHRVHGPPRLAEVQSTNESAHGRISGEVRDHLTAAPIANATLTFRHENEDFETHSDGEGRFGFSTPREGVFVLAHAEAPGYFPLTPTLDARMTFRTSAAHSLAAVQLRLHALTPLRVFVHGVDGALVSARVRSVGESTRHASHAVHDVPDGNALVPAAEGTTLEATTLEPPAVGHARVNEASIRSAQLHVHTRPLAPNELALRGQVLSLLGSEPISRVQVDVESESAAGTTLVARLVTGADGHFSCSATAPGPFVLTARAAGFATESRTQVTPAGEVVLLLSEEASIEGRVVDEGGAPVPSFAVFVEAHAGTSERHLRARSDTFDVNGEFRIGGLSSGDYTVSVAASGFAPLTREVRLSRGASARPEDFRLRRGQSLEGIVRGEDDRPLANVLVRVENAIEGTGLPLSAEVQTDDEGFFRVEGLSAGEVRLSLALAGHRPQTMTVRTSDAPVDVTLSEMVDTL